MADLPPQPTLKKRKQAFDPKVDDLSEPAFKKTKQDQKEPAQEKPEENEVKLNDLPELPFEKILGYLSLQDRIKARAVSRRWCKTIDSFRPKSLCYSMVPSGLVYEKARLISGTFARNFISSFRFESFFQTFGQSILSSLQNLRLCGINLTAENEAAFARTLNSFGQLKELGLFQFDDHESDWLTDLTVNLSLHLPILNCIQLENVLKIKKLTLDAPRLQEAKFNHENRRMIVDLVHPESVEKLITTYLEHTVVKKLKNLKFLYCGEYQEIDSTLLSTLEQLNEIHLYKREHVVNLFEQKQRYGRAHLKIFLQGCPLNGPDDRAILSLSQYLTKSFVYLAENHSRLADDLPFEEALHYATIERVDHHAAISVLNRFTHLNRVYVDKPVRDIKCFLDFLNNFKANIKDLSIKNQSQALFEQLPAHCAVQILHIWPPSPPDLRFLFRLKHLIQLWLSFSIDVAFIRKALEELPFLSLFFFKYKDYKEVRIEVRHHPKQFGVMVEMLDKDYEIFSALDSVIRFIRTGYRTGH